MKTIKYLAKQIRLKINENPPNIGVATENNKEKSENFLGYNIAVATDSNKELSQFFLRYAKVFKSGTFNIIQFITTLPKQ